MKKITSLLLLLLADTIATAQPAAITDLKHQKLKGPVRSVRSSVYEVRDSNGVTVKKWTYTGLEIFNIHGNLIYTKDENAFQAHNDSINYSYDAFENLIREEVFGPTNILEKGTYTIYDSEGKRIQELEKEVFLDDDDLIDTGIVIMTFRYNSFKKVSGIWRSENNMEGGFTQPRLYVRFTYPDTGWSMIRNEYNYADKPDSSETRYYKFDKNGKTIKSHSSQSHSLSEYNTSGQLTKLQELSPKDSTLLYSETRSYDKFGNQISSVTYDVLKKKIRYALTSEFTKIDAEKNWLRVKSYKDGKWTQYCEREITYYK